MQQDTKARAYCYMKANGIFFIAMLKLGRPNIKFEVLNPKYFKVQGIVLCKFS